MSEDDEVNRVAAEWLRLRGIPYVPEVTVGWGEEKLSVDMQRLLKKIVTNVDKPVFAFRDGVPTEVIAASMTRYSRNSKTLRWVLGKEFLTGQEKTEFKSIDTAGARDFFKRVLIEYGDDSPAQLGFVAVAAEYISQLAVKEVEDGRLGAYLEKSTRYLDFSKKVGGRYLYFVPPEIVEKGLGGEYEEMMNKGFDLYVEALSRMKKHLEIKFPQREGEDEKVWKSAVRSKAFDLVRVFLPMSTLTNVGMVMSAQAMEAMLTKMKASELTETRWLAEEIKDEADTVVSTLIERLGIDKYGGVAVRRLQRVAEQTKSWVKGEMKHVEAGRVENKVIRLIYASENNLDRVVEWIVSENSQLDFDKVRQIVEKMSVDKKSELLQVYLGDRSDRRHKPGRAFELARYTLELVTTVGEWRDLQRHRLLTLGRQLMTSTLGWNTPKEFEEVEVGGRRLSLVFKEHMEENTVLFEKVKKKCGPGVAQYLVRFGNLMRWTMDVNLRELYHLIPLRAGKAGHPNYRRIVREVFYELLEKDPQLVGPMAKFVDFSDEPSLERREQLLKVAGKLQKSGLSMLDTDTFGHDG